MTIYYSSRKARRGWEGARKRARDGERERARDARVRSDFRSAPTFGVVAFSIPPEIVVVGGGGRGRGRLYRRSADLGGAGLDRIVSFYARKSIRTRRGAADVSRGRNESLRPRRRGSSDDRRPLSRHGDDDGVSVSRFPDFLSLARLTTHETDYARARADV